MNIIPHSIKSNQSRLFYVAYAPFVIPYLRTEYESRGFEEFIDIQTTFRGKTISLMATASTLLAIHENSFHPSLPRLDAAMYGIEDTVTSSFKPVHLTWIRPSQIFSFCGASWEMCLPLAARELADSLLGVQRIDSTDEALSLDRGVLYRMIFDELTHCASLAWESYLTEKAALWMKEIKNARTTSLARCKPLSVGEISFRDKLAEQLNGETEVFTESGYIDVLTSDRVIEVKLAKSWKAAIGQALAYGYYYPERKPCIYLFDVPSDFDKNTVSIVSSHLGVEVIYDEA